MKLRVLAISLGCIAALLFAGMPTVSAAGQLIFTSTADFDAGNKTDLRPLWFVNNALDQPMYSQINQPQAIYSALFQRTYSAYFGAKNGSIYVTYYDHILDTWQEPHWLATTGGTDGHKNPAIYVMTSGRIVVACCAHDTDIKVYRTAGVSGSIDAWVNVFNVTGVKTYPGMIEYPAGTLWLFYRTTSIAASGDFGYRKSTDEGISWSVEVPFIDMGAGDTLYWGKWDVEGSKLYVPWVKLNFSGTGSRQDVFVCYMNLDTGEGFSLLDVNLGTTINPTEANASCRVITQLGSVNNNHPSLDVLDSRVYMLYMEGQNVSSNWHVNFTSWNGAVWSSPIQIAEIGASSSYNDISVTSAANAEAFITTPGYILPCTGDCEYTGDMERWTWNGSVWTLVEVILTEEKSGEPVNHPYYVWGAAENGITKIKVVFDQFIDLLLPQPNPGDARYGWQQVYAWGTSGFVGKQINDGTTGVETFTDNPIAVASGTFQLANGRSDSFVKNDSDSDNWKFHFTQSDDGTADCVRSISSGEMIFNYSGTGGGDTGRKGCFARSTYALVGDFNWSLRFFVPDQAGVNNHAVKIYVMDIPGTGQFTFSTGSNGGFVEFYPNFFGDRIIKTFRNTGGIAAQIGTDTIPGDIHYLRIVRVGTAWTTWYSVDGITFTQDETFTGSTNDMIIHFGTAVSGMVTGSLQVNFDEFNVTSGTLDNDGYRATGSWFTAIQTYTGEVAHTIVVNYSEVSATQYIDSVAIVDSDTGAVLFVDGTNQISGTTATYTVTANDKIVLFNHNWKVRVTLAGNGLGSPVISEITINTTRSTLTIAISDMPWILVFLSMLTLGLFAAFVIKRKRNEGGT